MIKKIIFFLFLSVISLAQQVELKSIERKIDANGESYTITTSQTYNKKNNKLEVLHIDKSPEQATYKEIIQFDIKGKKELNSEKFFYDPSLKKWSKDIKKVTSYKNNKKIEEIYKKISGLETQSMKVKNQRIQKLLLSIVMKIKSGFLLLKHILY